MKFRDFFPLGKASGEAFCNRETETQWLLNNIFSVKHSLLMAPRRFGKSSLAEKAIINSGLAVSSLNFNTCTDERDIADWIGQGVSHLIGSALGPVEKVIHWIKQYVSHISPKIILGPAGAHLELTMDQRNLPAAHITEVLKLIEKLLAEKNLQAVMLMDEFQAVGQIAKGHGVEAALRNAAQEMKQLTIIFSGSNRHLLKSMFEDEGRPLYKLCRKLSLKRIEAVHYRRHLRKAARLAWNRDLSEETFERIMSLSERHPYYVNYLCDIVWSESKELPTIKDVDQAWQLLIEEEQSDANAEISNLSLVQKKVLRYIANYAANHLLSSEAIQIMGKPLSSITTAINGLLEKDMIEKQNHSYQIINPVIKALALQREIDR